MIKTQKYSLVAGGILLILVLFIYQNVYKSLPEIKDLKSLQIGPIPMRIYTKEGELIAASHMHAVEGFIGLEKIPPLLVKAFFAAEDHRFWDHKGVDYYALLRATLKLLMSGRKAQGGSTITMQVARNFYLKNRDKTFLRKLKEIILARRLEKKLPKQAILELYLNKIYVGNGEFGICAAAKIYLQKKLQQLTLDEMALLASLPQAPSLVNPIVNPKAAQQRRNIILKRMYRLGYLSQADYEYASQKPVIVPIVKSSMKEHASSYVADLVQETFSKYCIKRNDVEYYQIYTTLNAQMQRSADEAVKSSILDYDRRHCYRGPEKQLQSLTIDNLGNTLEALQKIAIVNELIPSVVTDYDENTITVMSRSGVPIVLCKKGWDWIIEKTKEPITKYIQIGDVVRVYYKDHTWFIGQLPEIQAALVAINPLDGAIEALSGGFSYHLSPFNRAIYALRQPGSVFKPFIYAAALAKGYTLADVFNDAPLVFEVPGKDTPWRPQNVTQSFQGLMRLRLAFVYSINSVTIRVLQAISFPYALKYIEKFGFNIKQWPRNLSLALGTGEVTPLTMASAYAVFANGGYRVNPYLISHITDSKGKLVYQAKPARVLEQSASHYKEIAPGLQKGQSSGTKKHAPRVISSEVAFLVNSALQDVMRYGTGQLAKKLGRFDIAGKTGTTNDKIDTWFIGYNDKVVTSVWVGYDKPRPLQEYASSVALPLWLNFMHPVLYSLPEKNFVKPASIQSAFISAKTGKLLKEGTGDSILEYFQKDQLSKIQAAQLHSTHHNLFGKQKKAALKTEPLF